MQRLLESGELDLARKRLRALCGRDPDSLDATELARATIESVAENTADAVTGPLFWAAVLGPAGAWLYRAANTLDAMVGHRSLRYERFGWCAARLDDALTWPAAQITALVCVALAPAGRKHQVATAPLGSARVHPSINAATLEAAFAAACGVRLAGTNSYAGRSERRASFEFGPRPTASDISPALSLSLACGLCFCAVSAAIARGLGR